MRNSKPMQHLTNLSDERNALGKDRRKKSLLSLPTPERKTSLLVQVESELLTKVKVEAKKRHLKLRQVVEHYLKQFLEDTGQED